MSAVYLSLSKESTAPPCSLKTCLCLDNAYSPAWPKCIYCEAVRRVQYTLWGNEGKNIQSMSLYRCQWGTGTCNDWFLDWKAHVCISKCILPPPIQRQSGEQKDSISRWTRCLPSLVSAIHLFEHFCTLGLRWPEVVWCLYKRREKEMREKEFQIRLLCVNPLQALQSGEREHFIL